MLSPEELAALRHAAAAHIRPDGQPHKWGASDSKWREYRRLATPQATLELVDRLSTVEAERNKLSAQLREAREELAEQEVEKMELVQANMGLGDLLGNVLAELKEAWGQGEWQNIHFLIQELTEKAGPKPAETPPQEAEVAPAAEVTSIMRLTADFSAAMLTKLQKAMVKYGYEADGWMGNDWEAHCRAEMLRHIEKGDPVDVANFCAFLWYHGWPTSAPTTKPLLALEKIKAALNSPEYVEGVKKALLDAESLKSHNPNRRDKPAGCHWCSSDCQKGAQDV